MSYLKTKIYINDLFVPRSKHAVSRFLKNQSHSGENRNDRSDVLRSIQNIKMHCVGIA